MLDLLVAPDMVSGIETYIGPEVAKAILLSPTIFSDVQQGVKADVNCTTALWTK